METKINPAETETGVLSCPASVAPAAPTAVALEGPHPIPSWAGPGPPCLEGHIRPP